MTPVLVPSFGPRSVRRPFGPGDGRPIFLRSHLTVSTPVPFPIDSRSGRRTDGTPKGHNLHPCGRPPADRLHPDSPSRSRTQGLTAGEVRFRVRPCLGLSCVRRESLEKRHITVTPKTSVPPPSHRSDCRKTFSSPWSWSTLRIRSCPGAPPTRPSRTTPVCRQPPTRSRRRRKVLRSHREW